LSLPDLKLHLMRVHVKNIFLLSSSSTKLSQRVIRVSVVDGKKRTSGKGK